MREQKAACWGFFSPRQLRNLRLSSGLLCIQLHGLPSDTTEINVRRPELIGRDYSGYVDVDEFCSTASLVLDADCGLTSFTAASENDDKVAKIEFLHIQSQNCHD